MNETEANVHVEDGHAVTIIDITSDNKGYFCLTCDPDALKAQSAITA